MKMTANDLVQSMWAREQDGAVRLTAKQVQFLCSLLDREHRLPATSNSHSPVRINCNDVLFLDLMIYPNGAGFLRLRNEVL